MTLTEMTSLMNEKKNTFGSDYAGYFSISDDEAERIAERSNSVEEFEHIWESTSDWKEALQ